MKMLIWHCDYFFVGNAKSTGRAKQIDFGNRDVDVGNSLVVWVAVESLQDRNYFEQIKEELEILSKRFNTKTVAVLPFVHLTNKPLNQKQSFKIIKELGFFLQTKGFDVKYAQFGGPKDVKMFTPADRYQCVYRSFPKPGFIK